MRLPIHSCDRTDRGQVLVLVAAAMIVLLGVAALVVDLGLSWMLRRDEQNAADPGAIAAARYIPLDNPLTVSPTVQTQMDTAACFYAKESGFFTSDDATCSAARGASPPQLEVNYPPSEQAGEFAGHPGRVEVIIRTTHEGFFGRIFGRSEATVVAGAVAANEQGQANSAALVALDPTTCKSGSVSGTNTSVTIEPAVPGTIGGYVHINSECDPSKTPNTSCDSAGDGALRLDGTGSYLKAPYVYVHGTCKTGSSTLDAPLQEGANRIGDPLAHLPPPPIGLFTNGQCGVGGLVTQPTGPNSKGCSGTDWAGTECEPGIECVEVYPGVYWGGWTIGNNMKIQMSPGVYYMAGGGVSIQAPSGSIESVAGAGGAPPAVMIFSSDNPNYAECPGGPNHGCQGGIDLLANSTFKLTGLTEAACAPLGYPVCPYQGLLLWQDGDGTKPDSVVKLGGGTNLEIAGTIYAPKAEVQMNGGSDGNGVASVQIIAWRWDISGGATLYMPYDPGGLWHPQSRGLVH